VPNELLRFWLESVASIAGIAALAAIALELQRARRADARDFLFQTHEKWIEIFEERMTVRSLEFSNMDDYLLALHGSADRQALMTVFNFWDLLTRTIRAKAIDKDLAIENFGRPFLDYFGKFSHVQHQRVELQGGSNWFESFDWFAEEISKILPDEFEAYTKEDEYYEKLKAQAA
jgi:hypothetical protein